MRFRSLAMPFLDCQFPFPQPTVPALCFYVPLDHKISSIKMHLAVTYASSSSSCFNCIAPPLLLQYPMGMFAPELPIPSPASKLFSSSGLLIQAPYPLAQRAWKNCCLACWKEAAATLAWEYEASDRRSLRSQRWHRVRNRTNKLDLETREELSLFLKERRSIRHKNDNGEIFFM